MRHITYIVPNGQSWSRWLIKNTIFIPIYGQFREQYYPQLQTRNTAQTHSPNLNKIAEKAPAKPRALKNGLACVHLNCTERSSILSRFGLFLFHGLWDPLRKSYPHGELLGVLCAGGGGTSYRKWSFDGGTLCRPMGYFMQVETSVRL